ncbi:MAG: hypothetical protein QXG10_00360 [Candidatus Hadarchaeales archaeon]
MFGPIAEERGVEPLAMKLFAGIILLVIGLSIAYGVYTWAGRGIQQLTSFSVTVSPSSVSLNIPQSGSESTNLSVTVEKIGDYSKTVTLSVTGEPTGVRVSFSPGSGQPRFGSTMTITVDNTATPGAVTLTIRGRGADDIEQTATLELTLV